MSSLHQDIFDNRLSLLDEICSSETDEVTPLLLSKRKDHGLIIPNFKAYTYQIYFTPYQCSSILFGLDPYETGNELLNSHIKPTQEVLTQYVKNDLMKKSKIEVMQDAFLGNIKNVQIHRDDLTAFAKALNIPEFVDFPDIPNFQHSANDDTLQQNTTSQDQITELQEQLQDKNARIAELEQELQNQKQVEPLASSYNPTERETHLQIIAIQSFELAKLKPLYSTGTGKVKQTTIADILEKEAKELFANPKSQDTYRKRIAEALKTYSPQAE